MLQRDQASGDRWVGVGGDKSERSWKGLNAQEEGTELRSMQREQR